MPIEMILPRYSFESSRLALPNLTLARVDRCGSQMATHLRIYHGHTS